MKTNKQIKELRRIARGSRGVATVSEHGINLVYLGRYEAGARRVVELVQALGGDVWECRKVAKSTLTGARTWRVEFTIGIEADLYVARGVTVEAAARKERADNAHKLPRDHEFGDQDRAEQAAFIAPALARGAR